MKTSETLVKLVCNEVTHITIDFLLSFFILNCNFLSLAIKKYFASKCTVF